MPEASSHTVFSNTLLHSQDQVQIWWHCSVNALCRVDWRRSPSVKIRVTFTAQTVSSVSVKQLKKTSNEQHEFKVSSLLMSCWLTDFFSNLDSGLDSVLGLRKIAAAEVVHLCFLSCSSFLFVIIPCHFLSLLQLSVLGYLFQRDK